MTDRDALLAAVLANPDDDTPRLVCADWLEEHGDPTRAEFIRVQCELAAGPPHTPRWRRLVEREQALLRAHKGEWGRTVRGKVLAVFLTRGFVGRVTLRPDQFVRRAAELFAAEPVTGIKIGAVEADRWEAEWDALLAHPPLARVRELVTDTVFVDDRLAGRLAAAPTLAGVTRLAFEVSGLTPRGVAALLAGPGTGAVRELALSAGGGITDDAARAVADSPAADRLTALDLSQCRLTAGGVRALAGCPRFGRLGELRVGNRRFGDAAAHPDAGFAVAEGRHLARLRTLDLSHWWMGPAAGEALAGSPVLAPVTALDLSANGLDDRAVVALARSPHVVNLRYLNLEGNVVTDRGAAAVLESPALAGLGHLNLKVGGDGIGKPVQAALRKRFGPGVCTFRR